MTTSEKIIALKASITSPTTTKEFIPQLEKKLAALESELEKEKASTKPNRKKMDAFKKENPLEIIEVKPKQVLTEKINLKKYYTHKEIKSVTVLEDGKKVTYKGSDVLEGATLFAKGGKISNIAAYVPVRDIVSVTLTDGKTVKPLNGYHIKHAANPIAELGTELPTGSTESYANPTYPTAFLEKGGQTDTVIELMPFELIPASNQLSKITGDDLNSFDYSDGKGKPYSLYPGAVFVHDESGMKFKVPEKIYAHIDGYNLVLNNVRGTINVYETNQLVAEIINDKLDFDHKDKSVVIDRTKVKQEFEKKNIPNYKNADVIHKKLDDKLQILYATYEDLDSNSKTAKDINVKISEIEALMHRLERKYSKGGSIEDFNLQEFLNEMHPKVATIFTENGLALSEQYVVLKGDNKYTPTFLFSREDDTPKSVVIGYFDKNNIIFNSLGEIEFELDEKEFHVRFPSFKINDVEMYAKGGWTNDHRKLNKSEDYEVRYNKNNPRKLEKGGEISERFQIGTPVIHHIKKWDGQKEESGEVVFNKIAMWHPEDGPDRKLYVAGELKGISLYPDKNYAGSSERFIVPNWKNVEKFSEAQSRGDVPFIMSLKEQMELGGEFDKLESGNILPAESIESYANPTYPTAFEKGGKTDVIEKGDIVKFSDPLPGENPDDRYLALEVMDDPNRPRIDIQIIGSDLSFPPINTIRLSDVELVSKNMGIGRLAKGKTIAEIAKMHEVSEAYLQKQLNRGEKVEMEHTTDSNVARAIAKDHLFENPDYYIMLTKMEKIIEASKDKIQKEPIILHNPSVSKSVSKKAKAAVKKVKSTVKNFPKSGNYKGNVVFSHAKSIRLPDETWQNAVARAKEEMKKEAKS